VKTFDVNVNVDNDDDDFDEDDFLNFDEIHQNKKQQLIPTNGFDLPLARSLKGPAVKSVGRKRKYL